MYTVYTLYSYAASSSSKLKYSINFQGITIISSTFAGQHDIISRCYVTFSAANAEDLRSIFLEDEINELKQSLKEEKQKNRTLQQLVETTEKEMLKHQ